MAHLMRNPGKTTYSYPPRCILQRPKLAALLGEIAAEWSLLEFHLAELYALLVGSRLQIPTDTTRRVLTDPSAVEHKFAPMDELATQIFEEIETTHLRFRLMESIADEQLNGHPALLRELKDEIIPGIRKASAARGKMIHGLWAVSSAYPDALILIKPFAVEMVYEESDFSEVIEKIINMTVAVSAFEGDLIEALGKTV